MPKKISFDEFLRLLRNPDVSDREIAKYLDPNSGRGGFNVSFNINPELVEPDRSESAMTFGNWWCRRRRRDRFERRMSEGTRLPVLVSEGDSWFQFPFIIDDVIDHLEKDYLVWSSGAAGDTAENMVFKNPEYMTALNEQAHHVSAFLLSAAGNDVIGEDSSGKPVLPKLLHRNTGRRNATAHDLINKTQLARVLDGLRDAYMTVLQTIRADARFTDLPILIHGYDYALPYPNGTGDRRNPYWAAEDEWLGGPMTSVGIDDPALRRDIVEYLIQELYDMLADVAATDPHVHLVDVRGTLRTASDWADEIHGTSKGFSRIATKFRRVLRSVILSSPEITNFESPSEALAAGTNADVAATDTNSLKLKPPELLIETRQPEHVAPELLGFGDMDKFARGFERTSARIARGALPEVAIEEDNSVPFRLLADGAERGRAVCKIKASGINFRNQRGSWSGTGFLIAPNILLTNDHVINSLEVARNSEALFNYQETVGGQIASTASFKLNPERLYIGSPFGELDYCFVWIEGEPQEQFGTMKFWRGSSMMPSGGKANVIHHPNGNPKRASLDRNEVIDLGLNEVLIHYTSDTEPGSSGSPVMTSDWRLFALHHASSGRLSATLQQRVRDAGYDSPVLNEGIKTSAIALDIDARASRGPDPVMARQVQAHLSGNDSRTGFFGGLGRSPRGRDSFEVVVDTYRGAPEDIDVGFWNIEWFNRDHHHKIDDVARIIADLNLDIWALEEASPDVADALVRKLRHEFDLDFGFAASEPDASSGKQTTTVIWNRKTVIGERLDWGRDIDEILRLRSDDPDASRFEAVEGKIFNRYPGLFRFEALNQPAGMPKMNFNLIPVHLKAKAEGAKRRRMASNVLAEVIARARAAGMDEDDWIIGGDVNAELSTGQFDGLSDADFKPMSAEDEKGGAITYLGNRYRSLIDTIFLSPGLARSTNADDFMIVARDRIDTGFIDDVSDHRPVMIRLSIGEAPAGREDNDVTNKRPEDPRLLNRFLREIQKDPPGTLEELAELIRRS